MDEARNPAPTRPHPAACTHTTRPQHEQKTQARGHTGPAPSSAILPSQFQLKGWTQRAATPTHSVGFPGPCKELHSCNPAQCGVDELPLCSWEALGTISALLSPPNKTQKRALHRGPASCDMALPCSMGTGWFLNSLVAVYLPS